LIVRGLYRADETGCAAAPSDGPPFAPAEGFHGATEAADVGGPISVQLGFEVAHGYEPVRHGVEVDAGETAVVVGQRQGGGDGVVQPCPQALLIRIDGRAGQRLGHTTNDIDADWDAVMGAEFA
jgi:hypothetical protein